MIYTLKACTKFTLFILLVMSYVLLTLPLSLISGRALNKSRKMIAIILSVHCKMLLKLLSIQVNIKGELRKKSGQLIVANHLGYLDIIILAAYIPSSFVTSIEMRDTFGLGRLCKLAACVFVNRKNKANISQEVGEITQALREGVNVIIFPEATSTNGDCVLRFRAPLFQSMIDAHCQCIPITLNYISINDESVNTQNRDIICWYDDMTFLDHFWKLLKYSRISVNVELHQKVAAQKEDQPLSLAQRTHNIVSQSFYVFKEMI